MFKTKMLLIFPILSLLLVTGCAVNEQKKRIESLLKQEELKLAIKEYKVLVDMKKGKDDNELLKEICWTILKNSEDKYINALIIIQQDKAIPKLLEYLKNEDTECYLKIKIIDNLASYKNQDITNIVRNIFSKETRYELYMSCLKHIFRLYSK